MLLLKRKIIFIFLIFFLIGGGFAIGILVGNSLGKSQCQICPPQTIDFSLFWEAYYRLQEKFVNPEKIDIKKIIYGAITGMVKSLEDPYTVFLNPEETKKFMEDVSGRFEGVGLEIGQRKGQLQVIAPLEGTPAQKAGLRAGDKIIKINDTLTADLAIDEAVNLIRGPQGTKVVLTVYRQDWEKPKEFRLIRDVILVPSLKWEITEGEIVHLKLYQFSEKATSDFNRAALEIINSPAKKIILDLRDNPGGYLEVAQNIAGWFLEKGQVVALEDFGGGKEKEEYKAEGPSKLVQYPLVILINQGSASGSEILAGALRDNRGIKIIGEKSFGKGSVQELENLKEGSLKITVAKWLTPKGKILTEVGLEPDLKIELTEEDSEKERDPQLDKAVEVLKEMR